VVAAVFTLLAIAAVGACGSSGSTSTTTTAAGPAGTPIRLGNVGTYSGSVGSGAQATQALVNYWVKSVNAAGGINGHPVEVQVQDDGGDPAKSLDLVKGVVQNDHVIGFVGNEFPTTVQASAPYLLEHQIPLVGGESSTNFWFTNPMFFPVSSGQTVIGVGMGKTAASLKLANTALWVCNLGAPCTTNGDPVSAGLTQAGVRIVNNQTISLTQSTYQANCLAAQQSGAQAVASISDPATYEEIFQSCTRIGYKPTYLFYEEQISAAFASVPGIKAAGVTVSFPWFLKSGSPALEEWAKATAGIPAADLGPTAANLWSSLKVMETALQAGVPHGGTPSTAELLKGLYSLKGETAGGLTPPLTYSPGKPAPQGKCWFEFTLQNQTFAAPNGIKPTCYSSIEQ
jgi:branched-chain amino acid transport system substrate-binding protein